MEERRDPLLEVAFGDALFVEQAYAETYGDFEQVETWRESVAAMKRAVEAMASARTQAVRSALAKGDGRDAESEARAAYQRRVGALVQSKQLVGGAVGSPRLAIDPMLQRQLDASRTQAASLAPSRRNEHVQQGRPQQQPLASGPRVARGR
jgi:hypothetical protein